MTDRRVVLVAFLLTGALTYGGLVGLQGVISGDLDLDTPDDVVVRGTTIHLDRVGRPTVVGEVFNPFDTAISDAVVTVTFYRDGAIVGEASGPLLRPVLPAGEVAPFDIHMATETVVDDYEVTVTFDRGARVVSGLEVDEMQVTSLSPDQVAVVATVTNTAETPLDVERAVATFYGANGSVVGARIDHPTPTRLAPGEDVVVEFTFRTLGDVPSLAQEYTRFDVVAVATEP